MKLKRGKKAVRLLASVNLKFSKLGKCNLHFLPRGLNIGLIKILRSCAYLVRYATRAETGDKGVTVFHNLDADAISEVYISDSAPASTER